MAQMAKLPARLHHNAYVTQDQEKTRRFYEEVIGMPLMATWCESDELFGKMRTYVHTFFGMADGGALAFFQFADPGRSGGSSVRRVCRADARSTTSALKVWTRQTFRPAIEARIAKAGIKPPQTYVLEHGYCRSVYVSDPNNLVLEFTLDHPEVEKIGRDRRADAHQELKRWLAGDHTSNNTYRAGLRRRGGDAKQQRADPDHARGQPAAQPGRDGRDLRA